MNTTLPIGPSINQSAQGCGATLLYAGIVISALNASINLEKARKKLAKESTEEEYDFIIIGGGSAGSVVANRLSELPQWNILLLEAGGEEPSETLVPAWFPLMSGSEIDWGYSSQPEPQSCNGRPCPLKRGKTLGGSSATNGMMYIRGNKLDYDEWESLGNEGWSYKHVLPFFKKSENNRDAEISNDTTYHGTEGPQDVQWFPYRGANIDIFHNGFGEIGYKTVDVNGKENIGVFVSQSTAYDGERRSTNWAFLKPVGSRKNLQIETLAHVVKILVDPETKTAYGVEYIGLNGRKRVKARKEVILSAGAINSPQILMLSGIGPKDHLDSFGIKPIVDLNGVGKNLQDHPSAFAIEYILNKTATNYNSAGRLKDFFAYKTGRQGPLASNGMLQLTAFFKTKYRVNNERPDIQFTFFSPAPRNGTFCNRTARMLDMAYYDRISVTPILIHPRSRGEILLNSADPLDAPLVYQHYFTDPQDIKTLTEGMKEAARLAETSIFKEMGVVLDETPKAGCEQYRFGEDAYWECAIKKYTFTIMHFAGTCKMGPDEDSDAVVDSRLRVKGIKNLRVIDASIMPLIVGGNTNAPTIMIGEKGAQYVKEDNGTS